MSQSVTAVGSSQISGDPVTTVRETQPPRSFSTMELTFVFILSFRNPVAPTVPPSWREQTVPLAAGTISAVRTSPDNLFSLSV